MHGITSNPNNIQQKLTHTNIRTQAHSFSFIYLPNICNPKYAISIVNSGENHFIQPLIVLSMFSCEFDSIQMSLKHTNHSQHTTEKYVLYPCCIFPAVVFRECFFILTLSLSLSAKPESSQFWNKTRSSSTQCRSKIHLEFIGFCSLCRFMTIEIDIFTGGRALFG